jgi:hypothetical protein
MVLKLATDFSQEMCILRIRYNHRVRKIDTNGDVINTTRVVDHPELADGTGTSASFQ